MQFTEHSLELSIMEFFENEGYTHQTGQDIHREKTDVLLPELLNAFLLHRYAVDGITESEIATIITQLKNISGSDYDANKRMLDLICNGFTFRRDIPELFKYNAFVVISDGVNNKIGSLFSPYEYFYAWR